MVKQKRKKCYQSYFPDIKYRLEVKRKRGEKTMNKKKMYQRGASCLLLFAGMLLLSCLLLCILSALVWKMDGNLKLISGGIIAIYIITSFFGGVAIGKLFGRQKFFWGLLAGLLYFAILLLVGVFCAGTELQDNTRVFPGFMICSVSGMLGGMISPGETEKL